MRVKYNLSLLWPTLSLLPIATRILATTESSGEYLQKVINELQVLNSPPLLNPVTSEPSVPHYKLAVYENGNQQDNSYENIEATRQKAENYRYNVGQYRVPPVRPTEKVDLDRAESEVQPQYYRYPQVQSPVITKLHEPEALGLTRAELAAMYKNALEKGSAVSLASLTNALAAKVAPQNSQNHLEVPGKEQMYQYYFFPLKTFASELTKTHGYKTIPAFENTQTTQTSPSQVSNPLFVAISTFISMALIFVMGILFLPKMAQYSALHAREMQDDMLNLSYFVSTVMDQYYSLERRNRNTKGRRRRRRRLK